MIEFIHSYWLEFITIASIHLLAVASPGPDFAIVLKHSVSYGRRIALITSLGVGAGILVHVSYSLVGIGVLIKTTPGLFVGLSYLAAAYLFYIGWKAIRSSQTLKDEGEKEETTKVIISGRKAFATGFLTNGLNPKATLFFLSIFAVVVAPDTPTLVQLSYGIYLAIATGVWFSVLSLFLSLDGVRAFINKQGYWFDRVMGAALILLAISLVIP